MADASTTLHGYIHGGSVKQVDRVHAYIRGASHPSTSTHAYMLGMPKTIQPAYIKGVSWQRVTNIGLVVESSMIYKQRVSSLILNVETTPSQRLRVTNLVVQIETHVEYRTSQHAYIEGVSGFEIEWAQVRLPSYLGYYGLDSQAAFIRGGTGVTSSQHAYIRGHADASTIQHAYLFSGNGAEGSQNSYIRGCAYGSTVQHAMLNSGLPTQRTSTPAYIWGQPGTRQHAFIHGGGAVRVTDAGTEVEWRYPATKRVTSAGSALEWIYPYWLRVTSAGLTVEWVYGSTTIFKVTSVGVMVEWSSKEDEFGPLVWMIS